MHATVYLKDSDKHSVPPVVVMHGGEWQLKQSALRAVINDVLGGDAENEPSVRRFAGKETELRTVRDELFTVSMSSISRRPVLTTIPSAARRWRSSKSAQ